MRKVFSKRENLLSRSSSLTARWGKADLYEMIGISLYVFCISLPILHKSEQNENDILRNISERTFGNKYVVGVFSYLN